MLHYRKSMASIFPRNTQHYPLLSAEQLKQLIHGYSKTMHMVTVTTLMPLVDQELLSLSCTPEFTPGFVCPFVLFLFAIVLSVLLRFTDSDNPFGIFKLFLYPFCFLSLRFYNLYIVDIL